MAVIEDLTLVEYDRGNRASDYYFQGNFNIPVGVGNSIIVRAVAKYSMKVHLVNCSLEESLSTKEKIEADVGEFELISDGTASTFVLDKGVSYLKATNTSGVSAAEFNITCI